MEQRRVLYTESIERARVFICFIRQVRSLRQGFILILHVYSLMIIMYMRVGISHSLFYPNTITFLHLFYILVTILQSSS